VAQKILLALRSLDEQESLKKALSSYEVLCVSSGLECMEKYSSFNPSLIIIDLLLPRMHGIEIAQRLKTEKIPPGIILLADQPLIQAYDAAKTLKIDQFIVRPFKSELIAKACDLFFQGKLSLTPLLHEDIHEELSHCYIPKIHNPDNYLKFWGTRGSSAVSGADYVRFGGNSSCLEIRSGDDLIIIDAGTGIRQLGELLINAQARNIHLFLSHTHWDHITGFPFFSPLYDPDVHLSIWSPVGFELETRDLFRKILAFTFFPVRLEDLNARVEFHDLRDGDLVTIGDLFIAAHYAFHPGATLCFRVTHGKRSFGYVTDNEFLRGYHGHPEAIDRKHPLLKPYQSQIEFLEGVDLLIHEAQYTPFEYQERVGWGHSSISNATVLLKHTKAKDWLVTHHDPTHTDAQLMRKVQLHRDIVEDCKINCRVTMAFDGLSMPL
jgi:phosphoribosyl 1,2-cyclic phosphodiesterase